MRQRCSRYSNSSRPKPGVLLSAGALRSSDGLKTNKAVDYRTDVTEFSLEGHRPFPYQVDGDYLGEVTKLQFSHEADAIRLLVPDPSVLGRPAD